MFICAMPLDFVPTYLKDTSERVLIHFYKPIELPKEN